MPERSPTFDPRGLLAALDRHRVAYIIVGAFARLPEIDAETMHKLAERLRGAMFGFGDSEQLRLFVSLLLGLMERMIREAATGEGAIGNEKELASRLVSRTTLPQWVEAVVAPPETEGDD